MSTDGPEPRWDCTLTLTAQWRRQRAAAPPANCRAPGPAGQAGGSAACSDPTVRPLSMPPSATGGSRRPLAHARQTLRWHIAPAPAPPALCYRAAPAAPAGVAEAEGDAGTAGARGLRSRVRGGGMGAGAAPGLGRTRRSRSACMLLCTCMGRGFTSKRRVCSRLAQYT